MTSRSCRLAAASSLLGMALGGCASFDLPLLERSRAVPMSIEVEERPGDDSWLVSYQLGEPAAGVLFPRDRNRFRADLWTAAAAGAEATWFVGDEGERLCFSEATQSFAVAFRTWPEPLPKDYELNVVFSEGSRLLYTGHLLAEPLGECDAETAEPLGSAAPPSFLFSTNPERAVRVLDRQGTGELAWAPKDEDAANTYAYFGGLEAIETSVATVLLDPELPEWMAKEMSVAVPRLVERFAAETGVELAFAPLLFVAWGGDRGSGISFSGGTLPGLLLASAEGPGWLEESPETRRAWFDRIAHEVFHLWDGEMFPPAEDSEWLSEAAADHFAVDAAVDMGVMSTDEADRWLVDQANDCLVRLGGEGLMRAVGGGDFRAWYACGAVALAFADAALAGADPPSDLATLFRALFAHAASAGSYGGGEFLGGLERFGVPRESIRTLQFLIGTGVRSDADRFLAGMLEASGVEVELVPLEEVSLDRGSWSMMVRLAIGRCYCGEDTGGCDPRGVGDEVTTVAGVDLRSAPVEAWERLTAAAARQGAVEVAIDGVETGIFCSADDFAPEWARLLTVAGRSQGESTGPRLPLSGPSQAHEVASPHGVRFGSGGDVGATPLRALGR